MKKQGRFSGEFQMKCESGKAKPKNGLCEGQTLSLKKAERGIGKFYLDKTGISSYND
jgi:hypothetical protein